MKTLTLISLCLLLAYKTFSQLACVNTKIETPAVPKPLNGSTASATCSELIVKWQGGAPDQTYLVTATSKGTPSYQPGEIRYVSCDPNQNCTAIIPVLSGTLVTWSVQAMAVIDGRTFYSYPFRGDQDYLIPECSQPPVVKKQSLNGSQEAPMSAAVKENLIVTNDRLAMYPNPVHDLMNINWNSTYRGNVKVTIVDASGKAVKASDVRKEQAGYIGRINVSSLKPGLYFVLIKTRDGQSPTTKFLKE